MDNMSFSELVTFIGCFGVCGVAFAAIGIWALCRKTPMHFWAGSTVSSESITDVKKYNLAFSYDQFYQVGKYIYTINLVKSDNPAVLKINLEDFSMKVIK